MIIANDNPKAPLKSGATANAVGGSSPQPRPSQPAEAPPSYGATQGYPEQHIPQPYPYVAQQLPAPSYAAQGTSTDREPAWSRFWRAFAVAVIIWMLGGMIVRSIAEVANHRHRGMWTGDFPVPSGISLVQCISSDQWSGHHESNFMPHHARKSERFQTSFNLSPSNQTMFLVVRGEQSQGSVNIITSPVTDYVETHLTMDAFARDARNSGVKACLVDRDDGATGVGIFSRRWDGHIFGPHRSTLLFNITVVLPQSANENRLREIAGFESDFPNGEYDVTALKDLIHFRHISLKGSNAPIRVESLSAERADVESSNGFIEGDFHTSASLSLKTSNAPIKVSVIMDNDNCRVTDLELHTSNSEMAADIGLTSPSNNGGKYLINAATTNGPLKVKFPSAPVDSTLRMQAITTNGPANIELHPTYEGRFNLFTSLFSPTILEHRVQDPSGHGRQRRLDHNKHGQEIYGNVRWGAGEGPGALTIKTSNAPLTMSI